MMDHQHHHHHQRPSLSESLLSSSSSSGGGSRRGGRNRWRGARERDRLQARFQIHERMRGITAVGQRAVIAGTAVVAAAADTTESADNDTCVTSSPPPAPRTMQESIDLAPSSSSNLPQENAADMPQQVGRGYTTVGNTTTTTTSTTIIANTDPYDDNPFGSSVPLSSSAIEILQEALQRIGKNNVAYFSLSCLNQHLDLFNRPFPVQDVLWWTQPQEQQQQQDEAEYRAASVNRNSTGGDSSSGMATTTTTTRAATTTTPTTTTHVRRLVSEPQLLSRWGDDQLRQFKEDFIPTLDTCTLVEWTVWTERYQILPALLLGGVDVTRHGRRRRKTMTTTMIGPAAAVSPLCATGAARAAAAMEHQLQNVQLGKRFFQLHAPCCLKAYLVKRVHELRKQTLLIQQQYREARKEEDDDGNVVVVAAAVVLCQKCHANRPRRRNDLSGDCVLVQFAPCHHVLCTTCVWSDLIDHCAARWDRSDTFVCPICDECSEVVVVDDDVERSTSQSNIATITAAPPPTLMLRATAQSRRAETMQKFQALPLGVDKSVERKKSQRRRSPYSSSWTSAINAGSTQPIRMEKFFKALDMMTTIVNSDTDNEATAVSASYSFVQHYLQQGVNVDGRGEYGETGLWLAVWKGQTRLVQLLLEYGSDPHAAAHGDVSCMQLARTLKHVAILNLLRQEIGEDEVVDDDQEATAIAPLTTDTALSIHPHYTYETLIDVRSDQAGAGSYTFDNFLPDTTIDALIRLRERIPVAQCIKSAAKPCSLRSYYCDALGFVVSPLSSLLVKAFGTDHVKVFPYMRFLYYKDAGVELAPHVDLSRADPATGLRSTHSFLLYLTTCESGGETALLQGLPECERNIVLAKVQPMRGRLLIFPHQCPHEGFAAIDVPKLLIRGEVYIPDGWEPKR